MKNKGFTLVELLAVVVILALILAITVPTITSIIEQSKANSYESQIKMMKKAAVLYANQNGLDGTASVTLGDLVSGGYLTAIPSNPITNTAFNSNFTISVVKDNGTITTSTVSSPELETGLIPVYFDEASGLWKKADSTNASNKWFDYNNFKWANAVTVTSTNRATYQAAAVGTTIPMSDINTIWVWIPRFKYLIPSGTGAREIKVEFETVYDTKSTGDAVTTYYTHPTFTFGTQELPGIWVGKFEMTGTISSLSIKPDLSSVRIQTVKAMYDSLKTTMQGQTTMYGFDNNNDIHMMKNEEWGAVAYLSQSKYGKYGNTNYIGSDKELYQNNSSSFYTGRSMGRPGGSGIKTPTNEYIANGYYTYDGKCATIYTGILECETGTVGQAINDKAVSYGASTSGTIYGVYDMAGGAWEYVMGVYKPDTLSGITDYSEFSSSISNSQYDLLPTDSKYYNSYKTGCSNVSCKGHALIETSSWYGDYNNGIYYLAPWYVRGSSFNGNGGGTSLGGIYASSNQSGAATGVTFRAVIAP